MTTHSQLNKVITVRGDAYQVTAVTPIDGTHLGPNDQGKYDFRLIHVATGDVYRAMGKKIMHNSKVELVARAGVEEHASRQAQPASIDVNEYVKPMARAEKARRTYAKQGDAVSLASVEYLLTQITKGKIPADEIDTILNEIAEEAGPSIPDDADATPATTSTNTRKATTQKAATVAAQPKERKMTTTAAKSTTTKATATKERQASNAPKLDKGLEALAVKAHKAVLANDHAAARKLLADGHAANPGYLVKGTHSWSFITNLVEIHEAKAREEATESAAVARAERAAETDTDATPVADATPATAPLADKAPSKGQPARDALDILRAAHWSSAGVLICGAMRGDEYRAVANVVKPLGSAWSKEGKGFKFNDGVDGPAVVTALLSGDTLPVIDTPAPANAAPVAKAAPATRKTRAAVVADAAPIAPAWPAASLPAIVDASDLDDASKAALAAAYLAAHVALTGGSATPATVPAKAAKAATKAPAKAAAKVSGGKADMAFTLAKWAEGMLGYRAAIKALRAALTAAGVAFELTRQDDRAFTITVDVTAQPTVSGIVNATVTLVELVNA